MRNTKTTCSKTFRDFPFSHRQPSHNGHCKFLHGHNWAFIFHFSADRPDESGFLVDFGKLQWLKSYLEELFDHTVVLSQDDPELPTFRELDSRGLLALKVIPSVSCEGIAEYLLREVGALLSDQTEGRAVLDRVEVWEDTKNHAACERA